MSVRSLDTRERQQTPLLAIADWARSADRIIDSKITGSSMGATLPDGTPIEIDPRDRAYASGSVMAVLSGSTVVAHRVVARGVGSRASRYWIMCGDAMLVPDPPVSVAAVIGRVRVAGGGEPAASRRPFGVRMMSGAIVLLVWSALYVDVRVARAITRACATMAALLQRKTRG